MTRLIRISVVLACSAGLLLPLLWRESMGSSDAATSSADAQRPELAYLKQVNQWRPPSEPELLFLLMGQFANANRHVEGIAYFEAALKRFEGVLSDPQKALYLTAIASLRAGHANDVFLLRRIGWVRDTLALLDEAKRLTRGEMLVARWMSGVVRAQLPGFFGERDAAIEDLEWCVAHVDRAPHAGWLREAYFGLAALHRARGAGALADRYQALSGLPAGDKPAIFTTPFSHGVSEGHAFSPRNIREIVPGSVYLLSGFEFTEYYFVVSADRRELIAIDAGTRPDSAQAAYEALQARVPALPPLTTVLVTHAHWDHVGGHRYFRSLNPAIRFYGRGNFRDELAHDADPNPATLRLFFGRAFSQDNVLGYKPDVVVEQPLNLTVGGTRFSLLPTRGGETDDAMLVHMPDAGILFAGDILMPYLGAPFIEEGSIEGLLAAIDQVDALKPRLLLHGHAPLTRIFSSAAMLVDLRAQLAWLRGEVLRAMQAGMERGAIQQANLVPPTLSASASGVHLAYLVLRENFINRLFDQRSGYWQNGMQGMDALTDADKGSALVDYLGVTERQLASASERMLAEGRHELAETILRWAQPRFPGSARLEAARRTAYLKLMEKYQEFNPFKFIVYAGRIDQNTLQINAASPIVDGEQVH